jgi:hypothetical protein
MGSFGKNRYLFCHVVTPFPRAGEDQGERVWANHFGPGLVSQAYQAVEQHARKRLRQWLCAKHKVRWPATQRFPDANLYGVLGLVQLTQRTRNLPGGRSCEPFSETDARNAPVRFNERGVKTEHDGLVRAPTGFRSGQRSRLARINLTGQIAARLMRNDRVSSHVAEIRNELAAKVAAICTPNSASSERIIFSYQTGW